MTEPKRWRLEKMRPLAWVETLLKVAAFLVVFAQFMENFSPAVPIPHYAPAMLAPAVVTLVLLLGLIAGVYDRLVEKEIFALVFILVNILAHGEYVYVLFEAGPNPLWFPTLMLAGDLVKLVEIRLYHMQVREFSPRVLYLLTGVYVVGYALILALVYTPT